MSIRSTGLRLVAVLVLMAALIGAISSASAQDVGDQEGAVTATGSYVSVSCWYDDQSGLTACAFAPSSDVGMVTSLLIPNGALCGSVEGIGSAAWLSDGIYQELSGDSIILWFSGSVSAGGSALYSVGLDGVAQDVAGDGVVCDESLGIAEIVEEQPAVETTVEPDVVTEEVTPESTEEVTPDATVESEPVTEDVTPVVDETGGEVGEVQEGAPAEVPEQQAVDVSVHAIAYDCTVDPGGSDPGTVAGCTPSWGVEISGTANGNDAGTQSTDGSGVASFTAPDGSAVVLTENPATIPAGFHAIGSGSAAFTASADAWATFVHLADEVAGRLQIVNGSCPTTGESRTEFRVIEPRSVAEASTPACHATGGTVFTIVGGPFAGGFDVTTGDDGAWRGYLPPGDYTVYDDSGASADVTVVADDVSVVIVVDYVAAPLGVLNVSRFVCENSDQTNIVIFFQFEEPTIGDDDGCVPSDADISIEVLAEVSTADVTTIDLGPDGVEEIELPSGSYLLTDVLTGESASFDLAPGSRLYAIVEDLAVGGDGVGSGDPGEGDGTGNGGTGNGSGTPGGDPGNGDPGSGNPGSGDPDTGSGGDGTDPDTGGGGSGSEVDGGDDTTGGVDAGSGADDGVADDAEVAGVTSLPATGTSGQNPGGGILFGLLLVVGGAIATMGGISRRRRGTRSA